MKRTKNIKLIDAMNCAGLNAKELSRKTSVSPNTISQLINQRRDPNKDTARRISKALGCSVKFLFSQVYPSRTATQK